MQRGSETSSFLALVFSAIGHAYVHMFTAMYFVIAVAMEGAGWNDLAYADLSELWTLGAFLVGGAALPAGWLGDRWSRTGMMVVYFIGMGLASILCGLVDAPTAMLLGLAGIGLFASIYHPVGIAWVVRNSKRRGKALGINGIFGGIGVATAGLVAGALIDLISWRAAFILPGVFCLITGLVLLFFVATNRVADGEAAPVERTSNGRGEMIRAFLILLFTMFCVGFVFQATQAALPKTFDLRLRDLVGEGAFGIGAVVALVYAGGSVVQIVGGHLADRMSLKLIYVAGFLLQLGVLLAIAQLGGLPLILAALITVLLSTGVLPAENMLLAHYTPQRHHGLAYGLKFVLAFGAAPLAIWLAAATQRSTGEYQLLFTVLAVISAFAFLVALFLPRERQALPQASDAQAAE